MAKEKKKSPTEIVNKRAEFEYYLEEKYEAGLVLTGTEIKSIRQGHVSLTDAYCFFRKGELYVKNMYIKEYEFASHFNHEPRRERKLLLKKSELRKLQRRVKERGYTIVPYRLYINERGYAKLEIALARGKKRFDKRESIKERDVARELGRRTKIKF